MVALRHPEPAAQHDVVLVAGVGVDPGVAALRQDDLDDRDVARAAPVDPLDPHLVGLADRALCGADDDRRRRLVDEEPGDRHVERVADSVVRQPMDGDALSFSICDR